MCRLSSVSILCSKTRYDWSLFISCWDAVIWGLAWEVCWIRKMSCASSDYNDARREEKWWRVCVAVKEHSKWPNSHFSFSLTTTTLALTRTPTSVYLLTSDLNLLAAVLHPHLSNRPTRLLYVLYIMTLSSLGRCLTYVPRLDALRLLTRLDTAWNSLDSHHV